MFVGANSDRWVEKSKNMFLGHAYNPRNKVPHRSQLPQSVHARLTSCIYTWANLFKLFVSDGEAESTCC